MVLRNVYKIVLALLLVACNNSDGTTQESTTYEFFDDSRMTFAISQTFDIFEIETGTNTVFKYYFSAEEDEDISDDEYAENVYFEVDGSLDSFSYSNDELQAQNLFIRRFCFCATNNIVFTDIGSVSGTKLANGNWDVDISITFQWDEFSQVTTKNISGIFSPGEL